MPNSTPFRKAPDSPLFCDSCGTSSRSVPITTPGAESTNNLTRARRLGPRRGQLQSNLQKGLPGALVAIPSPPRSLTQPPGQRREPITHADEAAIHTTPLADLVVTIPLRTPADPDSSRTQRTKGATPIEANEPLLFRRKLRIASAGLLVCIALTGIAWLFRAKRSDSGSLALVNAPAAPSDTLPLNPTSVQSTGSPKSAAPHDEIKSDDSADRGPQITGGIPSRARANASTEKSANGAVDLANQYLRTEGVPRGCEKAMLLLNTAAAKGNVRARNRLASLYAVGSCVPHDPVQSYRWLEAALKVDPHNQWAQQNRALILRQMTPEERSQVEKAE